MDKLDEQLVQVVVMQRQIPPLAQKMLEGLEIFVNMDLPFYKDERQERIDLVRGSLANPKVTASEQVRQILEATTSARVWQKRFLHTKVQKS